MTLFEANGPEAILSASIAGTQATASALNSNHSELPFPARTSPVEGARMMGCSRDILVT